VALCVEPGRKKERKVKSTRSSNALRFGKTSESKTDNLKGWININPYSAVIAPPDPWACAGWKCSIHEREFRSLDVQIFQGASLHSYDSETPGEMVCRSERGHFLLE
jgi:hypothetical protein